RGGHRQGPRRRAARGDGQRRRAGDRDRRAPRRAPVRHPGGREHRPGGRRADAGVRRAGPLRQRLDGAEGRGAVPVRPGQRPARRDHLPPQHRAGSDRRHRHRRRTRPRDPPEVTTERNRLMPSAIEVSKVPIHSVADASELATLIDDGVMDADRVIAIIGKTEGNGGGNDYTRIIADRAFREVLVEKGADAAKVKEIPIVWSGGTDGVISPPATIFATTAAEPSEESRLTVGFAMSEVLLPEDIGRTAMIEKVADAVKVAMERAGIADTADVHYVQTKTPLLTLSTIEDAKSRGKTVFTEDTLYSMDVSNGGTALGIA